MSVATTDRLMRPEAPRGLIRALDRRVATPDLIQRLTDVTARAIGNADNRAELTNADEVSIRTLQSLIREQQQIAAMELELWACSIEVSKSEQELKAQRQADERLHSHELRVEQQSTVRGWILTVVPVAWLTFLAVQWMLLLTLGMDITLPSPVPPGPR